MADELDDLLDEFDEMLSDGNAPKAAAPKPTTPPSQPSPSPSPIPSSTTTAKDGGGAVDDDIDALLNDFDLDLGSPPPALQPAASTSTKDEKAFAIPAPKAKGKAAQKCLSCFLGGSSDSFLGRLDRRSERKSCDKMMCVKCNFAVAHFDDVRWHESCDYLFFRAANTDGEMLKPKMVPAAGHRAYCCQCLWTDVANIIDVNKDGNVSGKWVCQRQHAK